MTEAIPPMVFLRFVSALRKTLNDYSVEQETVGATLRMAKTFTKLQRALSPKKNGMREYYFGIQLYQNNRGDFFSHVL